MTKIIAVSNQKGGVGKTTTAVNLSASLAAIGHKTLLIDFDPQRNASVGVSVDGRTHNVYTFLSEQTSFSESIFETFVPNLYVLPSTLHLSALEFELATQPQREYILKKGLQDKLEDYDYVFIDCPPSFGLLSLNAWTAAHFVLIPLQCEYYALEGLVLLLDNILKIKKTFNAPLSIYGLVLTMYDKRSVLSQQIESDVRQNLGDKVFQTLIPRNVKIAEAPSHGKPVLFYDIKCSGSLAYLDLAKEFLKRETELGEI
ncbi:chromosome partitioning protein ParA [Alphaproteobacteria bacterium]|nr:chromosome partitioning protein ParA [Alphaproteobacteria bacterium]GHS96597.1 chromosome partitioning protein ParA [Alphaproteobacteria bacterium]